MARETATTSSATPAPDKNNWWLRMLVWRERHIPDKTFVALLALVVGIAAGLAAVLLKTLIGLIAGFLTSRFNIEQGNLLYLVFPEDSQHVLVTHRFVGDHRFWWIGRCRGPYRVHGCGNRQ